MLSNDQTNVHATVRPCNDFIDRRLGTVIPVPLAAPRLDLTASFSCNTSRATLIAILEKNLFKKISEYNYQINEYSVFY